MAIITTLQRPVTAASKSNDNWEIRRTEQVKAPTGQKIKGTFLMVVTDFNNLHADAAASSQSTGRNAMAAYICEINGQTFDDPTTAPRAVERNDVVSVTGAIAVQNCQARAMMVGLVSDTNLF